MSLPTCCIWSNKRNRWTVNDLSFLVNMIELLKINKLINIKPIVQYIMEYLNKTEAYLEKISNSRFKLNELKRSRMSMCHVVLIGLGGAIFSFHLAREYL